MLPKLVMVILVVGATASALLVNRQQRIETFHEMSVIHHRLLEHETTLWQLRAQIAQRCRPEQVRGAVARLGGEWVPIPARPNRGTPENPLANMRVVKADGTEVAPPPPAASTSKGLASNASTKKKNAGSPARTASAASDRPRTGEHAGG